MSAMSGADGALFAIKSGMQSIANVADLALDQKLIATDYGALITRKIDRMKQDWALCEEHEHDQVDNPDIEEGGKDANKSQKWKDAHKKVSSDACRFILKDANTIQRLRELAGLHQTLVQRALELLDARIRSVKGNFERFVRLRDVAAAQPERLTVSGMKRHLMEKYKHILDEEQGGDDGEDPASAQSAAVEDRNDPRVGNHIKLTTDEQEQLDRVLPITERTPLHFSKATRVKKKAHPEFAVNDEPTGPLFKQTVVDDEDGFDLDHSTDPLPKPPLGLRAENAKLFL
ncbi:unnamed protein product [Amoebophrya sp. A120]|nr:unnamed protein product [Amoebophrya sp. A120]|eukprot:GSA120T00002163001.1